MANLSLQGQNHYLQDKVCKQLKRNKQLETESCNISSKLEITASTTSKHKKIRFYTSLAAQQMMQRFAQDCLS